MRWGSEGSEAEPGVTLEELSLLAPRFPEKSIHSLPSAPFLIGIVPLWKSRLALLAVS